jgi:hypothetical protein
MADQRPGLMDLPEVGPGQYMVDEAGGGQEQPGQDTPDL